MNLIEIYNKMLSYLNNIEIKGIDNCVSMANVVTLLGELKEQILAIEKEKKNDDE